jgi:type II secretory pathway component PulK
MRIRESIQNRHGEFKGLFQQSGTWGRVRLGCAGYSRQKHIERPLPLRPEDRRAAKGRCNGSVLIIVLWVAFGLVSLTLYFAHSMLLELRAADNRMAAQAADQAIEGAARYTSNVLARAELRGALPDPQSYRSEAVAVGEATFWLIGRGDDSRFFNEPLFGLVDEASRLNLNTATLEMLEMLPGMTPEFAAAIIDWRDADDEITPGGAEMETYMRQTPSYVCKNAPFESIEELRLVYGASMELLYGGDANWNGIPDLIENDGALMLPYETRGVPVEPGLLEFVTVYSREPNTRADGSSRININGNDRQDLAFLLEERLGAEEANEILARIGSGRQFSSLLDFYLFSGMRPEAFDEVWSELTVSEGESLEGLINVNTAGAEVLACVPGIGWEHAGSVVAQRLSRAGITDSLAWVAEVLEPENLRAAGPYLTGRSYQFTADTAAVGPYGRGYRRVKFVFDTTQDAPRIIYRRDLTHLGWALGSRVREEWLLANALR